MLYIKDNGSATISAITASNDIKPKPFRQYSGNYLVDSKPLNLTQLPPP